MPNYTIEQLCTDGLPYVMAYLVDAARKKDILYYGDIASFLQRDLKIDGRLFPVQMGRPVGALIDKIHENCKEAPLINILVFNQIDKRPGEGADTFLAQRYNKSIEDIRENQDLRTNLIDKAKSEVYAFRGWDEIFNRLFGRALIDLAPQTAQEGTEIDYSTSPGHPRGGDAESPEHKALKERVAADPALVGIEKFCQSPQTEFRLKSGDEVDVYVFSGTIIYLIEVKSRRSNDVDFERGIFQCIKYRSVYEAMQKYFSENIPVTAMLVTERALPRFLDILAKQHNVVVRTLPF